MSDLRARLARLRRETPREGEATPGTAELRAADTLPAWLAGRLGRGRTDGAEAEARAAEAPAELVEESNALGTFAARTRTYAAGHVHGCVPLARGLEACPRELAWLARDPALESLDPATAVWLDIETTGLSGGAGTIPFLVALGRFEDGAFVLWQAFCRHPGEEAAALHAVAERVAASSGVVSFFGKSFDRHRLEDKMRLHRIAPPFAALPHLDLYHPLARLYRGAWTDGRLQTCERELVGVERTDDLPGSLAPAAWFDFLAGRAHRLEAVFTHNELDVLSLVGLAAHLAAARAEALPDGTALAGPSRPRAFAVAELHVLHREHAAAVEWYERALTRPGGGDGLVWFRRAEALRKAGDRDQALRSFLRLARERDDALGARAWAEVFRLARRLRREDLVQEARDAGPRAIERNLTGTSRCRALVPFQRAASG